MNIVSWQGVKQLAVSEQTSKLEEYWVDEPYAKIVIVQNPGGSISYYVNEQSLSPEEQKIFLKARDFLEKELDPKKITRREDLRSAVLDGMDLIAKKYHKHFMLSSEGWRKIRYYLTRNLLGFGPINPLMQDPNIEDISCNGVERRLYVWHRKYDSIPTNIVFIDKDALDSIIIILSHKAEKHISSAFPIVDGMLYGKDRLAATFREEVSPKGSTFTIRKFRTEPFSIIDLVKAGALSPEIAGYFWTMLENRMSVIVIGGTAAGKTTLLNALACLMKPGLKIVTVEETPELNLPHENWVQLVSRSSYGMTGSRVGEVSLFDLVKTSLRYRPDYLLVGEIRGEEAYVLFQALATGHGGMSTLHAENIEYAVKRLTSKPMEIAETYIPLMNIVCLNQRVFVPSTQRYERRLRNVWEVVSPQEFIPVAEWNPTTDQITTDLSASPLTDALATKLATSKRLLMSDIAEKTRIINSLLDRGVRSISEVAQTVQEYYSAKNGGPRVETDKSMEAGTIAGIMSALAASGGTITLTELKQKLKVSESAVESVLSKLERYGAVMVQNDTVTLLG